MQWKGSDKGTRGVASAGSMDKGKTEGGSIQRREGAKRIEARDLASG